MASEITDSWWNLVKVDDKAWQLVAVALFVRMLPLPHHEAIFSLLAPSTHHQHYQPGNPDETCVSLCKAFHTIPRILKVLEELNSYSHVKLKFMLV